jgi:anti-sigma-K factor RskA
VTVVDPPPKLKDRLMAQIDTSPVAEEPAADEGVQQPSWWTTTANTLREWFGVSAWRPVLAGGMALIILALVAGNILLWQETRPSIPAWRRAILTGSEVAPEARGIIYISPDGRNGTIVVDGLPVLESEQQYQLWLIKDGKRDSGAVFSVNADGYRGQEIEAPIPLRDYSAFGVTIEPAGGSPGPTGQRVLGFNL